MSKNKNLPPRLYAHTRVMMMMIMMMMLAAYIPKMTPTDVCKATNSNIEREKLGLRSPF